eukprot:scaffold17707_cov212-Amphora_coffeaeformis.AAC.4
MSVVRVLESGGGQELFLLPQIGRSYTQTASNVGKFRGLDQGMPGVMRFGVTLSSKQFKACSGGPARHS